MENMPINVGVCKIGNHATAVTCTYRQVVLVLPIRSYGALIAVICWLWSLREIFIMSLHSVSPLQFLFTFHCVGYFISPGTDIR